MERFKTNHLIRECGFIRKYYEMSPWLNEVVNELSSHFRITSDYLYRVALKIYTPDSFLYDSDPSMAVCLMYSKLLKASLEFNLTLRSKPYDLMDILKLKQDNSHRFDRIYNEVPNLRHIIYPGDEPGGNSMDINKVFMDIYNDLLGVNALSRIIPSPQLDQDLKQVATVSFLVYWNGYTDEEVISDWLRLMYSLFRSLVPNDKVDTLNNIYQRNLERYDLNIYED